MAENEAREHSQKRALELAIEHNERRFRKIIQELLRDSKSTKTNTLKLIF